MLEVLHDNLATIQIQNLGSWVTIPSRQAQALLLPQRLSLLQGLIATLAIDFRPHPAISNELFPIQTPISRNHRGPGHNRDNCWLLQQSY